MTIVKICGLRSIEHTLAAVEAGADLLGFIFAPSRRQVSPAEVAAIRDAVYAAPGGAQVGLVGVFVNETPRRMIALARECGLDAIQLSGDEDAQIMPDLVADRLECHVIKALRLAGAPAEQGWLQSSFSPRLLVDAHVPGAYGGAGVVADWNRAAALAAQYSVILAGGLTPDNVGAAIRRVRPWGVDVSSGVETDGVKDSAKIRAFIAAVRAADQEWALAAP
jgi:phosphoribosylanthranilate isomerase